MKYVCIALAILLALTLLCVGNLWVLEKSAAPIREAIRDVRKAIPDVQKTVSGAREAAPEEIAAALEALSRAQAAWNRREGYFYAVIPHVSTAGIPQTLARCRGYLERGDAVSALSELAALEEQLDTLLSMERLSLANLL